MRFNIYDHNDNITIVDTKDKDIDVFVLVL